jgi:alpha-tubulin suppressor-like RCC1 family protein
MKRYIIVNALFTLLFLVTATFAQTFSWGRNSYGHLGFPGEQNSNPVPQSVSALSDITAISGGEDVTLFLRANGTIGAGGTNSMGAMGIGNIHMYPIPSTVLNMTNVAQVSGGAFTSTALKADGTVWGWGPLSNGEIGNNTLRGPNGELWSYTPLQTWISDVVQISSGQYRSIALKSDGTVWSWGSFGNGQVGGIVPARVGETVPGFENLIAVATGYYASAAIKSDGTVWVWGYNSFGLNGDGIEFPQSPYDPRLPRQVPNFGDVVQIAVGEIHIVALKRDGTVWVWGNNYDGECGRGSPRDFLHGAGSVRTRRVFVCSLPNQVMSDVVEIKSGGWHILARKRDGSVWVWGANWHGQIGNGTSADNSMYRATPFPTQALVGTGNAVIGAAVRASFAVKPVIQTPVGFGVKHYGENVQMLFSNVTNGGTTAYTAFDPATVVLNVPSGYTIQSNQPAYNITTTAQSTSNIEVCVKVNEYSSLEFSMLKILHAEGANWVDRTFSSDFMRRQVCAQVDSLGSFVIAKAGK